MSRGNLYCTNRIPGLQGQPSCNVVMQMLSFDCFIMNLQVLEDIFLLLNIDNLKSSRPLKPHRVSMRIHYLQNPRWLSAESLLNEKLLCLASQLKLTDNFVCSEPERYHTKKLWFYQCPKYTIFVWAEVFITPWFSL